MPHYKMFSLAELRIMDYYLLKNNKIPDNVL